MAPRGNVLDMFIGDGRPADFDFSSFVQYGLLAVVHQASQGSNYIDPYYAQRRKACEVAGLLWGAYHLIDGSDEKAQAENFLQSSGISDNGNPFMVAVYYEMQDPIAALHQVLTFVNIVERNAPFISCVIRGSDILRSNLVRQDGGFQDPRMSGYASFFSRHRLWLQEDGPSDNVPWPWKTAWLWKYYERQRGPFFHSPDIHTWPGSKEELTAQWLA